MFGAIIGDIIGFPYEKSGMKTKNFELFPIGKARRSTFSDDTILTIAVAHSLMTGLPYNESFHKFGDRFLDTGVDRGFGGGFLKWFKSNSPTPFGSMGNGAAMRVSPIGWYAQTDEQVLELAKQSAEITHNTEEAVKSAQVVAFAVYLAKQYDNKNIILEILTEKFPSYNLRRKLEDVRKEHVFSALAEESVPEAIISFLESHNFIDAIRNAVSLGGDSDTQASIAGAIAEAFYGSNTIPKEYIIHALNELPDDFIVVMTKFQYLYMKG